MPTKAHCPRKRSLMIGQKNMGVKHFFTEKWGCKFRKI